jgi:hypothetical protein
MRAATEPSRLWLREGVARADVGFESTRGRSALTESPWIGRLRPSKRDDWNKLVTWDSALRPEEMFAAKRLVKRRPRSWSDSPMILGSAKVRLSTRERKGGFERYRR